MEREAHRKRKTQGEILGAETKAFVAEMPAQRTWWIARVP